MVCKTMQGQSSKSEKIARCLFSKCVEAKVNDSIPTKTHFILHMREKNIQLDESCMHISTYLITSVMYPLHLQHLGTYFSL